MRTHSPRLEWVPNLLRRGSECYWLLGLAVGDTVAAGAGGSYVLSACKAKHGVWSINWHRRCGSSSHHPHEHRSLHSTPSTLGDTHD